MRKRYVVPIVAVIGIALLFALVGPDSGGDHATYFVAPGGSDNGPGSFERPFGTLEFALRQVRAGDTLYLRGGEYREHIRDPQIHAGERNAPIIVAAWPGERPVLIGLLWLQGIDYWTIRGLHVTWDPRNPDTTQHMVKISGGTGWTYTNAEVWGAQSFAGLLVTGGASNWTLSWLYVHDTQPVNELNQDQLIYISDAADGVIEHCLLVNSPNGRGVKLGRPSPGSELPSGIVVRNNTFVANSGGAISSSFDARNNTITGNLMHGDGPGANVNGFDLFDGSSTSVTDNVGWGTETVVAASAGFEESNNQQIDPALDASYRPTNPALLDPAGAPLFGHLAGGGEADEAAALSWQP